MNELISPVTLIRGNGCTYQITADVVGAESKTTISNWLKKPNTVSFGAYRKLVDLFALTRALQSWMDQYEVCHNGKPYESLECALGYWAPTGRGLNHLVLTGIEKGLEITDHTSFLAHANAVVQAFVPNRGLTIAKIKD